MPIYLVSANSEKFCLVTFKKILICVCFTVFICKQDDSPHAKQDLNYRNMGKKYTETL